MTKFKIQECYIAPDAYLKPQSVTLLDRAFDSESDAEEYAKGYNDGAEGGDYFYRVVPAPEPIARDNSKSHLGVIWKALQGYREDCIPEGSNPYDAQWDDICTAMAWITYDLNAVEYEPDVPHTFTFNIACDVRAYGTVRILAMDIEEAKAKLTAGYVSHYFEPHGSGSDDIDHSHPRAIWSESARDEETGEEFELGLDVPAGSWEQSR